jgi:hypothetical protein
MPLTGGHVDLRLAFVQASRACGYDRSVPVPLYQRLVDRSSARRRPRWRGRPRVGWVITKSVDIDAAHITPDQITGGWELWFADDTGDWLNKPEVGC